MAKLHSVGTHMTPPSADLDRLVPALPLVQSFRSLLFVRLNPDLVDYNADCASVSPK